MHACKLVFDSKLRWSLRCRKPCACTFQKKVLHLFLSAPLIYFFMFITALMHSITSSVWFLVSIWMGSMPNQVEFSHWDVISMGVLEVTWALVYFFPPCLCWMVLWPRGRTPLMCDLALSMGSWARENPVVIRARRSAVFSLTSSWILSLGLTVAD